MFTNLQVCETPLSGTRMLGGVVENGCCSNGSVSPSGRAVGGVYPLKGAEQEVT